MPASPKPAWWSSRSSRRIVIVSNVDKVGVAVDVLADLDAVLLDVVEPHVLDQRGAEHVQEVDGVLVVAVAGVDDRGILIGEVGHRTGLDAVGCPCC